VRAVYGISLVVGFLALLGWILAVGFEGRLDPEERFGLPGRRVVGGLVAFGMGGLSAAYGGWSPTLSFLAAVVASGVVVWYVGTT
jgi:CHASE2 domain-containing sensor protein